MLILYKNISKLCTNKLLNLGDKLLFKNQKRYFIFFGNRKEHPRPTSFSQKLPDLRSTSLKKSIIWHDVKLKDYRELNRGHHINFWLPRNRWHYFFMSNGRRRMKLPWTREEFYFFHSIKKRSKLEKREKFFVLYERLSSGEYFEHKYALEAEKAGEIFLSKFEFIDKMLFNKFTYLIEDKLKETYFEMLLAENKIKESRENRNVFSKIYVYFMGEETQEYLAKRKMYLDTSALYNNVLKAYYDEKEKEYQQDLAEWRVLDEYYNGPIREREMFNKLYCENLVKEKPYYAYTKYIDIDYYLGYDHFFSANLKKLIGIYYTSTVNLIKFASGNFAKKLKESYKIAKIENSFLKFFTTDEFLEAFIFLFGYAFIHFGTFYTLKYAFFASIEVSKEYYWSFISVFGTKKQKRKYAATIFKYRRKAITKELKEDYSDFEATLLRSHYELITFLRGKVEQEPEIAKLLLSNMEDIYFPRLYTIFFKLYVFEFIDAFKKDSDLKAFDNFFSSVDLKPREIVNYKFVDVKSLSEQYKGDITYSVSLASACNTEMDKYNRKLNKLYRNFKNPNLELFDNDYENLNSEFSEADIEYLSELLKEHLLKSFEDSSEKNKEEIENKKKDAENLKKNI